MVGTISVAAAASPPLPRLPLLLPLVPRPLGSFRGLLLGRVAGGYGLAGEHGPPPYTFVVLFMADKGGNSSTMIGLLVPVDVFGRCRPPPPPPLSLLSATSIRSPPPCPGNTAVPGHPLLLPELLPGLVTASVPATERCCDDRGGASPPVAVVVVGGNLTAWVAGISTTRLTDVPVPATAGLFAVAIRPPPPPPPAEGGRGASPSFDLENRNGGGLTLPGPCSRPAVGGRKGARVGQHPPREGEGGGGDGALCRWRGWPPAVMMVSPPVTKGYEVGGGSPNNRWRTTGYCCFQLLCKWKLAQHNEKPKAREDPGRGTGAVQRWEEGGTWASCQWFRACTSRECQ